MPVNRGRYALGLRWVVKGRPSAPGIEFFLGRKQFGVATRENEVPAP